MAQRISLPNDNVAVLGRASLRENAITFDWSNSGVYFRFRGEKLSIEFDVPALSQQLYVQIVIVGRRTRRVVCEGSTTVTVDAAFDGEHIVHCVRVNEVLDGVPLVMNAFTFYGENAALLTAPALPERRMLFIGDSITCGYGILTNGTGNGYKTVEQDSSRTFAALTARHFDAQAQFVCISGRGIARNCDNFQAPLIPEFFEQTSISDPTPWDHNAYQPDIIVINAGTNDTAGEESPVAVDIFKSAVTSFIKRLRTVYPHSQILWVYGMMAGDLHDALSESIDSFGDATIQYQRLQSLWGFENEQGASCHPNLRSHHRNAGVVIDKVCEMTGWEK